MEENKKSNKGLIITIVCLIVLLVVLIGYVVSEKVLSKELNNNSNATTITTKIITKKSEQSENIIIIDSKSEGKLTKINLDACKNDKICYIKFNKLNIEKEELEGISINDKKIIDSAFLEDMYILDTNIIFVTAGTDIRGTQITILDQNGKLIKEIRNLDNKYTDMVIQDGFEEPTYKINEKGIILNGTRITHGPSIASVMYDEKSELSDKEKVLSYCDTYNKFLNEVVYGTYEIDYFGDNKFSEIKNTGYTLLKDSDIKCE